MPVTHFYKETAYIVCKQRPCIFVAVLLQCLSAFSSCLFKAHISGRKQSILFEKYSKQGIHSALYHRPTYNWHVAMCYLTAAAPPFIVIDGVPTLVNDPVSTVIHLSAKAWKETSKLYNQAVCHLMAWFYVCTGVCTAVCMCGKDWKK